jgi:hypothetical protein
VMNGTSANVDVLETVRGGRAATARRVPGSASPPVVVATSRDLSAGSVLIKSGARLPEAGLFELKQFGGWKVLSETDGFAVERALSSAGWHFFFVVPEICCSALSLHPGKALRTALNKAFAAIKAQNLNALEIVEIVRKRFLGVNYVRVVAHPRYVKDSPFLRGLDPHHVARNTWNFKGVLRRRAQVGRMQKGI